MPMAPTKKAKMSKAELRKRIIAILGERVICDAAGIINAPEIADAILRITERKP